MPKFTIELDSETHKILKESARKDERSLTQYMQRVLRQHAGTLNTTETNVTSTSQSNQHNNTTISTEENKKKRSVIGLKEDVNNITWREEDMHW